MGIREKKKKESVLVQSCATGDSLRQLGLERQFECKRKPLRKKKKKTTCCVSLCVCVCTYACVTCALLWVSECFYFGVYSVCVKRR